MVVVGALLLLATIFIVLAFWWFLIEPVPPRNRLAGPWAVGYVAAAKILMGLLGVVLVFTTHVIYDHYKHAEPAWGLTHLQDINMGGAVMSFEQSLVLIVFFTIAFARMMESSERAQLRQEKAEAQALQPWYS